MVANNNNNKNNNNDNNNKNKNKKNKKKKNSVRLSVKVWSALRRITPPGRLVSWLLSRLSTCRLCSCPISSGMHVS